MAGELNGLLGVVIVTFSSEKVIEACLASLVGTSCERLRIVVCDNDSPDDTVDVIRNWIARLRERPGFSDFSFQELDAADVGFSSGKLASVTLVHSGANRGYAGGVNLGLKHVAACQDICDFWILNPDCEVHPQSTDTYLSAVCKERPYALMGGRTLYLEPPNRIQSDGGRVGRWTGVCRNINQGLMQNDAIPPNPDTIDFISGANVVVSREFYEFAGPMAEDYFLYYEEVDWAFRRGDLPIRFCPDAVVLHHGGTAIGSGAINRRASAFSNYFNFRNRFRFLYRFNKKALPTAYVYSMLKVAKLLLTGAIDEAVSALFGIHQMAPNKAVADRLARSQAVFLPRRTGE